MEEIKVVRAEDYCIDFSNEYGDLFVHAKWDGCCDINRYYNGFTYKDRNSKDPNYNADYIHICDLREFIKFLTEVADRAEQIEGFEGYEKSGQESCCETIAYVETGMDEFSVKVIIPNEQNGYIAHPKSVEETLKYIPIICKRYNVKQIFIEVNGCGIYVYDCLCKQAEKIKDINVVPIYNRAIKIN